MLQSLGKEKIKNFPFRKVMLSQNKVTVANFKSKSCPSVMRGDDQTSMVIDLIDYRDFYE